MSNGVHAMKTAKITVALVRTEIEARINEINVKGDWR